MPVTASSVVDTFPTAVLAIMVEPTVVTGLSAQWINHPLQISN